MKLLFLMFLSAVSFATPYSYYADFTSPPQVMTTYYPSQPQLELEVPSGPMTIAQLINTSATPIEANCNSPVYPISGGLKGSFVIPAYSAIETPWTPMYQQPLGYKCWFRSTSGTISTGTFEAIGWGK